MNKYQHGATDFYRPNSIALHILFEHQWQNMSIKMFFFKTPNFFFNLLGSHEKAPAIK